MVLWLILMSTCSDLSFHYNSISHWAPFTAHCNPRSGPRVGKRSWSQPMCIIYIFLKAQYKTKPWHNRVLNKKTVLSIWSVETKVTNAIILWSLIRSADLSASDASAAMPVMKSDLVSLPSTLFPLSFIPDSAPFLSISCPPDPLHAYLGLCGLSLIGEPSLRKVHPALNITQRAFQHLQQLQQTWRDSTGSCSRQQWQQDHPPLSLWAGSVTIISQRQLDLHLLCVSTLPNVRGLLMSVMRRAFLDSSYILVSWRYSLSPSKATFLFTIILYATPFCCLLLVDCSK